MDAKFRDWTQRTKSVGTKFIPFAVPGFTLFHDASNAPPYSLDRNLVEFKRILNIAKKYVDLDLNMMITTFNDWSENTYVEPSVEDGFQYLQAINDFAAGS